MKPIKSNPYLLLGRIKQSISRESHIKCANIYISENNLKHIALKHKTELSQIGITALELVRMIIKDFNQIRQGANNSYWLVIYNTELPKAAAISLNFSLENEFWEIKTATPMRVAEINKKKLVWQSSALSVKSKT